MRSAIRALLYFTIKTNDGDGLKARVDVVLESLNHDEGYVIEYRDGR